MENQPTMTIYIEPMVANELSQDPNKPKCELGSNDTKNKMAVKSTFRSSNRTESFQSTTFQFSIAKVP